MPLSGLLVVLVADATLAHSAVEALASDPRVSIGTRSGTRLPIALQTETRQEDEVAHAEIRALPGVEEIEIAYIQFEERRAFLRAAALAAAVALLPARSFALPLLPAHTIAPPQIPTSVHLQPCRE